MSLLNQLRTLLGHRRQRRTAESGVFLTFLENSRLVTAGIFLCTVAAIVVISSAGLNPSHLPVQPNQLATTRIVAALPFTYESASRTAAAREQVLDRVPPVYKLDQAPLQKFEAGLREL
ncbi:MAG: hypothetical protein RIS54_2360, partial [Verrucomicrobiota bacterium]